MLGAIDMVFVSFILHLKLYFDTQICNRTSICFGEPPYATAAGVSGEFVWYGLVAA